MLTDKESANVILCLAFNDDLSAAVPLGNRASVARLLKTYVREIICFVHDALNLASLCTSMTRYQVSEADYGSPKCKQTANLCYTASSVKFFFFFFNYN